MEQERILEQPVLVVVDLQRGFREASWGASNNPGCEANIARLVDAWERDGLPIVVVQHNSTSPKSPLHPESAGNALEEMIEGRGSVLIKKCVNSAFYGDPDLDSWLRERSLNELVICGITTNHCCETTARMAGNLGYEMLFVLDATRTFDRVTPRGRVISAEELAEVTAANLDQEFGTVVSTESMLARLDMRRARLGAALER